jgi:hypothetical protein
MQGVGALSGTPQPAHARMLPVAVTRSQTHSAGVVQGTADSSIWGGLGIAGQSDGGGMDRAGFASGGMTGQSFYYEAQAVVEEVGWDAADALPLAVALPAGDGVAAEGGIGDSSAFSFIASAPTTPAVLRAAAPLSSLHTPVLPPTSSRAANGGIWESMDAGVAGGSDEVSAFGFLAGDTGADASHLTVTSEGSAPQHEDASAFSFLGDINGVGGQGAAFGAAAPSAPSFGGVEGVGWGCSQHDVGPSAFSFLGGGEVDRLSEQSHGDHVSGVQMAGFAGGSAFSFVQN